MEGGRRRDEGGLEGKTWREKGRGEEGVEAGLYLRQKCKLSLNKLETIQSISTKGKKIKGILHFSSKWKKLNNVNVCVLFIL